jgi:NAD(P)H dehydrogenase (quinone)
VWCGTDASTRPAGKHPGTGVVAAAMSAPLFAVTGSTGHLGGRVAARLAAAGARQRLVVRDAARAPRLDAAEVAVATYDDVDAMVAAFTGAETVFLVSAAEHPERVQQHYNAVDAAARAGVRQVVYTSFVGAAADSVFLLGRHHWLTEQRLRESGVTWTFLRDQFYLDFVPFFAGDRGVIAGPAGDGVFAPVARVDVADVAAAVLLDDTGAHHGVTYDVTGGRLASMAEWAAELADVTGRPVTYVDETEEQAYASRAQYGAPHWEVEGWVTSYQSIAAGEAAVVSDTVERLAGHPPTTLRQLLTS